MEHHVSNLDASAKPSECLAHPHNPQSCKGTAAKLLTVRGVAVPLCDPCLALAMREIELGATLANILLDQWKAAAELSRRQMDGSKLPRKYTRKAAAHATSKQQPKKRKTANR